MGLALGFSCGSRDDYPKRDVVYVENPVVVEKTVINNYMDVNPKPHHFKIKKLEVVSKNTILLVNYPNCITFKGDKLLLVRGIHKKEDFKMLDPHFLDEKHLVIARFLPTQEGWKMARVAAVVVNNPNIRH